ncbi:hypothetical protein E5E96_18695 [Aeromonas sp. 1805]|uniref:HEPN domain-containing protein n=1 Tax=Aeromonas sp. 1805 TaxID=2560028 RepID=UPI00148AF398|nr:HEPN domain-containing protein [Aeromonas sp. 1805]QJT19121.1 hypothetical protein E5E96_18695 [Aeromonas sp. 1805]
MSSDKNGVSDIFKSCILNKNTIEEKIYSDEWRDGNIISITNAESFEVGFDNFSKSPKGKFISKKYIMYYIEKTLSECGAHPDDNIKNRVNHFNEIIDSLDVQREHRVVKQAFGVNMGNSEKPINAGPLCFYEVPRHGEYIKLPFQDPFFKRPQSTKTVAQLCVKSLDSIKALEVAETLFNTFELSIYFLCAEKDTAFSIGSMTREISSFEPPIIYTEGSLYGMSKDRPKPINSIDLTRLIEFFPEKQNNLMEYFFNVILSPTNQVEKKISRAVEWIGEAYRDKNRSSALLKVVVALEALFKVDESSIITASIMASMAEQCAHISGKSIGECLGIEKYVKDLYGRRSQIVHSGSNNIGENELKNALTFSRTIIFNLLRLEVINKFKTMGEFQKQVREGKYRACPLWSLDH